MEWKWSVGEPYQRSARFKRNEEEEIKYDKEKTSEQAYQQSFLSENDNWSLDEFDINGFSQTQFNKREDTYNKMSEREMMCQVNRNPFMPNNTYMDDVITQDQFLKPINTSMDREKGSMEEM